eukprot:198006-Pyramimonas_sp.AAC.1
MMPSVAVLARIKFVSSFLCVTNNISGCFRDESSMVKSRADLQTENAELKQKVKKLQKAVNDKDKALAAINALGLKIYEVSDKQIPEDTPRVAPKVSKKKKGYGGPPP